MRLNGWLRIGVVLSISWAIGAAIYERNVQIGHGKIVAKINYVSCMETKPVNVSHCGDNFTKDSVFAIEPFWPNVAFIALWPIVAGWFVVYLAILIFRWIKSGFSHGSTD